MTYNNLVMELHAETIRIKKQFLISLKHHELCNSLKITNKLLTFFCYSVATICR